MCHCMHAHVQIPMIDERSMDQDPKEAFVRRRLQYPGGECS